MDAADPHTQDKAEQAELRRKNAIHQLGTSLAALAVQQDIVACPGDTILILTGAARGLVAWALAQGETPDDQLLSAMADTYDVYAGTFAALAENARAAVIDPGIRTPSPFARPPSSGASH